MPTKKKQDDQGGLWDVVWSSEEALKHIATMEKNDEARKTHATAKKKLGELVTGYIDDAGLEVGTRVRIGDNVFTVVEFHGGGTESKEWSSLGRSALKPVIE